MRQVKRLLPYVRRYVQMAVYDVLDAIDRHGDTGLSFDDSPEMKHVSEVIERLKRSARIGDNVRLMDVEPIGRA